MRYPQSHLIQLFMTASFSVTLAASLVYLSNSSFSLFPFLSISVSLFLYFSKSLFSLFLSLILIFLKLFSAPFLYFLFFDIAFFSLFSIFSFSLFLSLFSSLRYSSSLLFNLPLSHPSFSMKYPRNRYIHSREERKGSCH